MNRICLGRCGWDASYQPPEVVRCPNCGAALGTNSTELLAAATPRPWERGTGTRLTIWADSRCIFEDTFTYARLADADLIVRAVNEYEALLGVEKAIREIRYEGREDLPPWFGRLDEALARLAETRGGPVTPVAHAAPVAYQFVGPIKRGDGWCTAKCDYDEDGCCRRCGCLDPERFVVIEFPTEQEDARRKAMARLQDAGIEVRRV